MAVSNETVMQTQIKKQAPEVVLSSIIQDPARTLPHAFNLEGKLGFSDLDLILKTIIELWNETEIVND